MKIITIFILMHTLIFANILTLTSDNPIFDIANKHTYNTYKIHVYAGQTLDISLYDMDADGDLYVSLDTPSSPLSAFAPIQMNDIASSSVLDKTYFEKAGSFNTMYLSPKTTV